MSHRCRIEAKSYVTLTLLLFLIAIVIPISNGILDQSPKAVESWIRNHVNAKEKITKLHFYWHEEFTGKNASFIPIANSSTTLPSRFGYTAIADVPLRIGPEPTSNLVGRAQGLFAFAGQNETAMFMDMNYVFTEGEFKGSSVSLQGRNPVKQLYSLLNVVGGTGVFRLARGIATLKTYAYNLTSGYDVIEYNVVVIHY